MRRHRKAIRKTSANLALLTIIGLFFLGLGEIMTAVLRRSDSLYGAVIYAETAAVLSILALDTDTRYFVETVFCFGLPPLSFNNTR